MGSVSVCRPPVIHDIRQNFEGRRRGAAQEIQGIKRGEKGKRGGLVVAGALIVARTAIEFRAVTAQGVRAASRRLAWFVLWRETESSAAFRDRLAQIRSARQQRREVVKVVKRKREGRNSVHSCYRRRVYNNRR